MHAVAVSQGRHLGVEFADDALVRPEQTDALTRALRAWEPVPRRRVARPAPPEPCAEELLVADRCGALLAPEAVPGFQIPNGAD